MSDKLPPGIVMICTDPQGRIIATVTDFERSAPGGYDLREAQAYRARSALRRAICHAYCSPAFAAVFDDYDLDGAMRRLRDKGWKITEILIGHEKENP